MTLIQCLGLVLAIVMRKTSATGKNHTLYCKISENWDIVINYHNRPKKGTAEAFLMSSLIWVCICNMFAQICPNKWNFYGIQS